MTVASPCFSAKTPAFFAKRLKISLSISYSNSDDYYEEVFYKDIIHDIMSSFDGIEYEIINAFDKYIDMD